MELVTRGSVREKVLIGRFPGGGDARLVGCTQWPGWEVGFGSSSGSWRVLVAGALARQQPRQGEA